MYEQKQKEGQLSQRILVSVMIAGFAVAAVFHSDSMELYSHGSY